jgi:signal transduction histidine kinase
MQRHAATVQSSRGEIAIDARRWQVDGDRGSSAGSGRMAVREKPVLSARRAQRPVDLAVALHRLARLGEVIAAQGTADDLCRLVVRQTARLIGAQRTLLVLESRPRAVAQARLPAEEDAGFLLGAISPWLDEASLSRQPCLRHIPEGVADARQRSCAVAPLVARGTVLGHLYADVDGLLGRFDASHRDLLATVAVQTATTLDNLRARQEIHCGREREAGLAEVMGRINATANDLPAVWDALVGGCRRALHGLLVGLSLVGDDGRIHLGAYRGPCEAGVRALFPLPLDDRSGSGRCILQARAVEYADSGHDVDLPPGIREGALALGFRSLAFVPLVCEGTGLGALWIARREAGALAPEQIDLLRTFADQAAIALHGVDLARQAQAARAAADAAHEARRILLAKLGREVRATTSAVIDSGARLLDTRLDPAQRDLATAIARSGDALRTTLDAIEVYAAIEDGRMAIEHRPFDLRDCVEAALDGVAELAAEKALDLAYGFEGNVPANVIGDAARLRQILLHLLSNAVRFTASGEVVVTLRHEPEGMLHVAVRDTGIGFAADGPGQRLPSFGSADASRALGGGIGLGLAISVRLAERMGGAIRAESAGAGRGSTFHLSLPAPAAAPGAEGPLDDGELAALAGRRVLVVDDNPTIRRVVAQQLARWGLRVGDAQSPAQALAWMRDGQRFDLAIVDRHMPGMDGVDLGQRLHEIDPGMPQVLFGPPDQREPTAEAARWFQATLAKPLRQSALFDTLTALLAEEPAPARCA